MPSSDSFYITTPIYYVNGKPHIGHVYTTLLADCMNRFQKMTHHKSFFLTGVDEHGLKVQQTAEARGLSPKELCDEVAASFSSCFTNEFNFQFDRFIRTTDEDHVCTASKLWSILATNGFIYKANYEGWYCVSDETFVTEANSTPGVDKDGNPCRYSNDSGHICILVNEENYMFRLSAFQEPLAAYYAAHPNVIIPAHRQREIEQFIAAGLKDISVSRSVKKVSWGIPVPGDSDHVMYVWIDALSNYLTGSGWPDPTNIWPASFHLLGKDIIRFHCIYWPAFLLAAKIPLPQRYFVHGWWMVNQQKMSKSYGNSIDPIEVARKYGVDTLKYFMLREASPETDPSISEDGIVARLNSDLANGIGNLLLRCWAQSLLPTRKWPNPASISSTPGDSFASCQQKLVAKQSIASVVATLNPSEKVLVSINADLANTLVTSANGLSILCIEHMQDLLTSKTLGCIFDVVESINNYIQTSEPWRLGKSPETAPARDFVMYIAMECLRICATLLIPFMPDKMSKLLNQLGVPDNLRWIDENALTVGRTAAGCSLGENQGILFQKYEEVKESSSAPKKAQKPSKKAQTAEVKVE